MCVCVCHLYYLLDLVERTSRRKINGKKGSCITLAKQPKERRNERVKIYLDYSDPICRLFSSRYLGHLGQDGLMMYGRLIESIHYGDLGIYRDDQSKPTPLDQGEEDRMWSGRWSSKVNRWGKANSQGMRPTATSHLRAGDLMIGNEWARGSLMWCVCFPRYSDYYSTTGHDHNHHLHHKKKRNEHRKEKKTEINHSKRGRYREREIMKINEKMMDS